MAVDGAGTVYVAEYENNRIRIVSGGNVSTLAGTGQAAHADGPAAKASFHHPTGVAVDGKGRVYVVDSANHCIRQVYQGQVTTLAGTCKAGGFANGPLLKAKFFKPSDMVLDGAGKIYVADNGNQRIRVLKLDTASSFVDDTFADFSKGTLSESGAKIYVSAKGNVQLLDRHDLYGDGHMDVVFSNNYDGKTSTINSYIYWGNGKKAGFQAKKRGELPTFGAMGNSLADLDDDGYVDIVFSFQYEKMTSKLNSLIYRGALAGFSKYSKTALPAARSQASAVADLNRDGHLDIVLCTHKSGNKKANSYIYWGPKHLATSRAELPTSAPTGATIADLDRDGHLDIVFSNRLDGATISYVINSHVYWGSKTGFSAANRTSLLTIGAAGSAVADLDGDGNLDIVFANSYDGKTSKLNSYIYWGNGTKAGYATANRAEIPAFGASRASVAHLNQDKHLDLVFSSNEGGPGENSLVYWGDGTKTGFKVSVRAELPTMGGSGSLVLDLNGDAFPDIVFFNRAGGKALYKTNSYVYWGSKSGFSKADRDELPTLGATTSTTADPGSVHDRKSVQTFTSRALDTGAAPPTYLMLSWKATVPKKTSLKIRIRSSKSPTGLTTAPWYGHKSKLPSDFYDLSSGSAAKIYTIHSGDRYIQYRATFEHDFGNTPVLDRVEITVQ